MLLSDRRRSLIFLCMSSMEAAWIASFVLLLFRPVPLSSDRLPQPLLVYGIVLTGLLGWIFLLELLGRSDIVSPLYEIIAFVVMLIAGLLMIRVLLYPDWPLTDLGWLPQAGRDVFSSPGAVPAAVAIFITNLFLWHRATTATGREISFFNVGMSFRRGLLLLIAGAGLYGYLRGRAPLSLLWLFLGFGLAAVALARIDEKARPAQSVGAPLPLRRMAQLAGAILVTVGGTAFLARLYTRDVFAALLRFLAPLWRVAEPLLVSVIVALARLLNPLLQWIEKLLRSLMEGRGMPSLTEFGSPAPPEGQQALSPDLPYWLTDLLPRILLAGVVILAIVGVTGLLFLWLERSRRSKASAPGDEEEFMEPGRFGRGLRSLRGMAWLTGRYGVSRKLLAAVSVENIYANVCRLARRRGFGRAPAQPPDDYLPVLVRAFDGHAAALERITAAYMQVHYGDRPVTLVELAAIREDFRSLRESSNN